MGLLDFFRVKQDASSQPTAVDYVEWLLKHLLSGSKMELTLDTRRPLPGSDPTFRGEAPPPCLPDLRAVINRLKVLSGVSPVFQAMNVVGGFERPRANHTVEVSATFLDSSEFSTCKLQLRIRRKTV